MLGMIVVFYSIEMVISTTAIPFFTSVHKIINVPKINCSLKYLIQFRLILEYYRFRLKVVSKRHDFIRIMIEKIKTIKDPKYRIPQIVKLYDIYDFFNIQCDIM